jgi:hypothetical protein
MSADLVEFAVPILDTLHENAGAAEWRSVLLLAATVWNMSCLVQSRRYESDLSGADEIRLDLVSRLADASGCSREECKTLVAGLEERKRTLFADDPRFVIDVRTVDTEDGVHVFALSRL